MSSFNENINWPKSLDLDFPNLRDNTSSVSADNEIVYAAHFNKVRQLILNSYNVVQTTVAGSGNGSFQKISVPITYNIPISTLIKLAAPALTATEKIPGNILPFELVLTKSTSYNYSAAPSQLGIKKGTSTYFLSQFGQINIFSNKISVKGSLCFNNQILFDINTPYPNELKVFTSVRTSSDTILIRGCVVDNRVSHLSADAGKAPSVWLNPASDNIYLKVAIVGIQ